MKSIEVIVGKSRWVARPERWSYREQVGRWRAVVEVQEKGDWLRRREDEILVGEAIELMEKSLTVEDLEFQHGHFQPGDLVVVDRGDEVVLFSNLFWSWRIPFYDAAFGYHWWMLGMEHVENLTPGLLEDERQKWLGEMLDLREVRGERERRLLNLALFERAVPALVVDRYLLEKGTEAERIIVEGARRELSRLLGELAV